MCLGEEGGVYGRVTGQSSGTRWVCRADSCREAPSGTVAAPSLRHSLSTPDSCQNRCEFPASSIAWFSEKKKKDKKDKTE